MLARPVRPRATVRSTILLRSSLTTPAPTTTATADARVPAEHPCAAHLRRVADFQAADPHRVWTGRFIEPVALALLLRERLAQIADHIPVAVACRVLAVSTSIRCSATSSTQGCSERLSEPSDADWPSC